jgi:NADH-quinone oxidoreductase subunit M
MSLLLLLILIPLAGAVVGAVIRSREAARNWALAVSLATLLVSILLARQFDFSRPVDTSTPGALARSVQVEYGNTPDNPFAIQDLGFRFHLGADTISLWLVILTAFLQVLAVAASFQSIRDRAPQYYAWMSLLLCAMLGCFISRDLLLFYIFFELTLVPMFFIIGIWGGPERRYAAAKFFLFTFTGSVFTLAAVLFLGLGAGSFEIGRVIAYAQHSLTDTARMWVLLALLAGFAVKVPLFPVHTWLPLAHTEAPTAGSVILAGVLLKLGTYGLLRLAVPIGLLSSGGVAFPNAIYWIGVLCVIGIIYGALVAWVQQDIKKLVAYSSVSHLGFCVLGLVALNDTGIQGSILYMINHGLSTGALFLVIGMIYDRYHTRDINRLSGLARLMPRLTFFFVLFVLSSIGLPGLNGFVSEFLTTLGAFTSPYLGIGFGVAAALGIILGAVYMLHMTACVIWGPLKTPDDHHGHDSHHEPAFATAATSHDPDHLPTDLNGREVAILTPLAVLVVVLGVLPTPLMKTMSNEVELVRRPVVLSAPVALVENSPATVSPTP